jgi:hypothetical protein
MTDPGWLDSDSGDTFEEDRVRHRRRGRLLGFAVSVSLWVLSVVPLARESIDGREGVAAVAVYLVVGVLSLGTAAVLRSVYAVLSKRRRFWSPWLFLIAAVVAVTGYAVQSAGDEAVPIAVASARVSRTH